MTYTFVGRGNTSYPESTVCPTAAGDYTVICSVAASGAYEAGTASADFTIAPREIGLSWGETDLTYNAQPQTPALTITGLVGNDTCTATITGAQTDVGYDNYTATVTGLSDPNYKLPADQNALSVSFSISPSPVTLEWTGDSFVYDGTVHCPTPTVTSSDILTGDTCTVTEIIGAQTSAGTGYTATATALSNSNYVVFGDSANHDFEITPKQINLEWDITSFVYDGTEKMPQATVKATDLCGTDTCAVTVTGGQTDVGNDYTATATELLNSNYIIRHRRRFCNITYHTGLRHRGYSSE